MEDDQYDQYDIIKNYEKEKIIYTINDDLLLKTSLIRE